MDRRTSGGRFRKPPVAAAITPALASHVASKKAEHKRAGVKFIATQDKRGRYKKGVLASSKS